MSTIEPLKLAIRFQPPKLAVIYKQNKGDYIHEIPISEQDLEESPEFVLETLMAAHSSYLSSIDPEQIIRLIETMQRNQDDNYGGKFSGPQKLRDMLGDQQDLASFNKYIDNMDLYSPREGSSDEEGFYEDQNEYDFDAIEREMQESFSDEDLIEL